MRSGRAGGAIPARRLRLRLAPRQSIEPTAHGPPCACEIGPDDDRAVPRPPISTLGARRGLTTTDLSLTGTAITAAVATAIALYAAGGAALFRLRMLVPSEVPNVRPTLVL